MTRGIIAYLSFLVKKRNNESTESKINRKWIDKQTKAIFLCEVEKPTSFTFYVTERNISNFIVLLVYKHGGGKNKEVSDLGQKSGTQ